VRDWLTVREVAERLGLSRQWVWELVRRGDLEGQRAGRLWLVRWGGLGEKKDLTVVGWAGKMRAA
jgi:excisionase family DNA binding protein